MSPGLPWPPKHGVLQGLVGMPGRGCCLEGGWPCSGRVLLQVWQAVHGVAVRPGRLRGRACHAPCLLLPSLHGPLQRHPAGLGLSWCSCSTISGLTMRRAHCWLEFMLCYREKAEPVCLASVPAPHRLLWRTLSYAHCGGFAQRVAMQRWGIHAEAGVQAVRIVGCG